MNIYKRYVLNISKFYSVAMRLPCACSWGSHFQYMLMNFHEHGHEAPMRTCGWGLHAHDHSTLSVFRNQGKNFQGSLRLLSNKSKPMMFELNYEVFSVIIWKTVIYSYWELCLFSKLCHISCFLTEIAWSFKENFYSGEKSSLNCQK